MICWHDNEASDFFFVPLMATKEMNEWMETIDGTLANLNSWFVGHLSLRWLFFDFARLCCTPFFDENHDSHQVIISFSHLGDFFFKSILNFYWILLIFFFEKLIHLYLLHFNMRTRRKENVSSSLMSGLKQ